MKAVMAIAFVIVALIGAFLSYKFYFSSSTESNLDKFYTWTKEDPLLTGPGLQGDKLLSAINNLEREEEDLNRYLEESYSVYPIAFLKNIAEISKFHEQFLGNPSLESAKSLIEEYKIALSNYKKSAQMLQSIIQSYDSGSDQPFIVTNFTATTSEIILADIERLVKNALALDNEITARKNCLDKGINCSIPSSDFKKPTILNDFNELEDKGILSKDIALPQVPKNTLIYGPYSIITPCIGLSEDLNPLPQLFYVTESYLRTDNASSNGLGFNQFIKLATTNFYRKVDPNREKYFANEGLEWISQTETTNYLCLDTTFQNTVVTLDFYFRSFSDKPIFSNIKSDIPEMSKLIHEGAEYEAKFFSEKYPSDTKAQILSEYYAYAYKVIKNLQGFDGDEGVSVLKSNLDEMLNRGLVFKEKLINYHLILERATGYLRFMRMANTIAGERNLSYIYGYRNMYGITFLPFSPAFYRLDENLVFLEKKHVKLPREYMTYQDALKKYPPEEIQKWHIKQADTIFKAFSKLKTTNQASEPATRQ